MLERGNEFVDRARDVFVRGEVWENIVMGEETNGFALTNTSCVGAPDVEAVVVLWAAASVG